MERTNSVRISWMLLLTLGLSVVTTGCRNLNRTQNGALVGGGLGSLVGAVIGHQTGHTAGGAAIGALAGGLAGGLIGNAEDSREQRDAAIARENSRLADARALTNHDLVKMSQSGISDDLIISSVRTRGGRFDLGPDAIIGLKVQGVSDTVILAVQKSGNTAPVTTTVVHGAHAVIPSEVIIVHPALPPPRIRIGVYHGRPYRWRGRSHHYHHHW